MKAEVETAEGGGEHFINQSDMRTLWAQYVKDGGSFIALAGI